MVMNRIFADIWTGFTKKLKEESGQTELCGKKVKNGFTKKHKEEMDPDCEYPSGYGCRREKKNGG